jgi:hypothetical protein
MTCPRSVESLRLITSMGTPSLAAQLEQHAADAGVQRDGVGLAHAAGVGEDEAG